MDEDAGIDLVEKPVRFGFFTSRMLVFTACTFLFSVLVLPVNRMASVALFLGGATQVAVRYRYRLRVVDGVIEVRNFRDTRQFDLNDSSLEFRFPAEQGSKYKCRMNYGMLIKNSSTDWVLVGATRVDCGALTTWFRRISELEEALVGVCPNALVSHD